MHRRLTREFDQDFLSLAGTDATGTHRVRGAAWRLAQRGIDQEHDGPNFVQEFQRTRGRIAAQHRSKAVAVIVGHSAGLVEIVEWHAGGYWAVGLVGHHRVIARDTGHHRGRVKPAFALQPRTTAPAVTERAT